ncbi:MAG: hypothetical protein RLN88_04240 [Ekhidna sp.]|uniref:hypothetical protein n=1 Tax=Ekhidna sp. TaxID=2608089 RepID=UPI0032ECE075
MKLTELFGEYTRPDFIGWLMTEEGQRHIDEVFAPADTDVNAIKAYRIEVLGRESSYKPEKLLAHG